MPSYRKYKTTRDRRQARVRRKVRGSTARPRLSIYRTARHIYAQVIDDMTGQTLLTASTLDKEFASEYAEVEQAVAKAVEEAAAAKDKKGKKDKGKAPAGPETRTKVKRARAVGRLIAKRAKEKSLETVVFDRNGFLYHGRVKALADGAREGGLVF